MKCRCNTGRLVRPHVTLGRSQAFRFNVDAFIFRLFALQKISVRSLRYPVVGSEVYRGFAMSRNKYVPA
jgi:hypothetical protein